MSQTCLKALYFIIMGLLTLMKLSKYQSASAPVSMRAANVAGTTMDDCPGIGGHDAPMSAAVLPHL